MTIKKSQNILVKNQTHKLLNELIDCSNLTYPSITFLIALFFFLLIQKKFLWYIQLLLLLNIQLLLF